MGTTLHTFMDIFNAEFENNGESVQLKKIVIPIIQRDYAQGRKDAEISRTRTRFIDSLCNAMTGNALTLDFIYGDVNSDGVMTPLDGQQRLTTLFLLHWYAARKERVAEMEYSFLKNFSYETRYSARNFCSFLIGFSPAFDQAISDEIINQSWFPLEWKKDPTISSMLVMLDAIGAKFSDIQNIWARLKSNAISFYFLPIKDMGLTDELYIKMNSRGKPLTPFEHFKAEFEHELRNVDEEVSKRISKKIDCDWTDMLWRYHGDDNVTDDEFLRYFRFVCDIICYQNGDTTQGKDYDEFELLKEFFSIQNGQALTNIRTLEEYFDCWCNLPDNCNPDQFLKQFISHSHEIGKIKIETRYEIDIFHDCLQNYADVSGNGNRNFPLNRIIILFAIVAYLRHKHIVSPEQFSRRLRIINNLVLNSEDEISDSPSRQSGNRMPAILRQVEAIIMTGNIDSNIEKNFNVNQLAEETEKITWIESNLEKAQTLFELEDHDLLQGQIGVIGLANQVYFSRFQSLFACNWDMVDCALMSIGNYGQQERNGKRYQLGSHSNRGAWSNLFHKSANHGFDQTKTILCDLLSRTERFTDDILAAIKEEYIKDCEEKSLFEWRYYYVKYDLFRPGSYGKYSWSNLNETPYEFSVMQTGSKWSENTYQPFLKAVDEKNIAKNYYGQRIVAGERYIECQNSAYVVKRVESDDVIESICLSQNDNGIDTEDRIQKMRSIMDDRRK